MPEPWYSITIAFLGAAAALVLGVCVRFRRAKAYLIHWRHTCQSELETIVAAYAPARDEWYGFTEALDTEQGQVDMPQFRFMAFDLPDIEGFLTDHFGVLPRQVFDAFVLVNNRRRVIDDMTTTLRDSTVQHVGLTLGAEHAHGMARYVISGYDHALDCAREAVQTLGELDAHWFMRTTRIPPQ